MDNFPTDLQGYAQTRPCPDCERVWYKHQWCSKHRGIVPCKVVIVGDGASGKTCLLIKTATNAFPKEYVPTVFDNYCSFVKYEDNITAVSLWDTAGPEDYDRLRPLSYPLTTVFLLAFSVISPTSKENITFKWLPEITHHCPGTINILIGTKVDLRDDPDILQTLSQRGIAPSTREEGEKLAEKIGAFYVETSALTGEGIKEMVQMILGTANDQGLRVVGMPPKPPTKPICPVDLDTLYSKKASDNLEITRKKILEFCGNKRFSDVSIVVEDQIIPAHKIILASGSPYFYDLLVSNKASKASAKPQGWIRKEKTLIDEKFGRYGSTSTFSQDNFCVYSVAGTDSKGQLVPDMLVYNLQTQKLESRPLEGKPNEDFPSVNLHSSVNVSDEVTLLFGGKCGGYFNNLWELKNGAWKKLQTQGVPCGRYGHSAVVHKGKMIIFGGYDNTMGINNDMFSYDIKTAVWEEVKLQKGAPRPQPRHSHFTQVVCAGSGNSFILLFGGRGSGTELFNDVWKFSIENTTWEQLDTKGGPSPRYGVAGFSKDNEVFIHGGYDGVTEVFADIWCFDINTNVWSSLRSSRPQQQSVKGIPPLRCQLTHGGTKSDFVGRFYHCVQLVSEGTVVIFGGRNEDHTCCLFLEIGDISSRSETVGQAVEIKEIKLSKDFSHKYTLQWLRQIYSGNTLRSNMTFKTGLLSTPQECQNKMAMFLNNGTFSDISVQTHSGDTIQGHKILFNANCTLFEAFLDSDSMFGDEKMVVPLEKLSSNDFSHLQSFLYGLEVVVTLENAFQILEVSNQCLVAELELQAQNYLIQNATSGTIDPFKALLLAQRLGIKRLEGFFKWFLMVNFADYSAAATELPKATKAEIEQGEWPGQAHRDMLQHWQTDYDKARLKAQRRVVEKEKEKCALQ